DLGSFEQVLGERVMRVRYVDDGGSRDEVNDALEPSLLVELGWPISAYDDELYPTTAPLAALVGKLIEAGLPKLGVCLGSQLIARALGARVYPA
ncbi:glutamine amidotransferase, partial [Burkholderia pseudomallei]